MQKHIHITMNNVFAICFKMHVSVHRHTKWGEVMSDNRNRMYVYGTAAQNVPKRQDEPRIKTPKRANVTKKRAKKSERMNVFAFGVLLMGLFFVLTAYSKYIDIHTKTLDASRVLTVKERELQKLKSENDAKEDSLNSKVELQQIYEVATTQYGMVHANENQIIVYKKNESEYIKQNEDIPTE